MHIDTKYDTKSQAKIEREYSSVFNQHGFRHQETHGTCALDDEALGVGARFVQGKLFLDLDQHRRMLNLGYL